MPLAVNLPEMDTPAWWHLKRKRTMYYDGRTDARSVRTNMQFLLGEKTLDDLKALEPTFRDLQAFLKSLSPPKYPFAIDADKAARGEQVFKDNCVRCHGTYGPEGVYPNKIVALDVIGTDTARSLGLSDRLVAHYNRRGLAPSTRSIPGARGYQAPPLDGIWATAPYLHNGSVPNLHALLESSQRPAGSPARRRPTSSTTTPRTSAGSSARSAPTSTGSTARRSPFQAKFIVDTSRFGMSNRGHTFGDRLNRKRADGLDRVSEDAVSVQRLRSSGSMSSTSGGVAARSCWAISPAWRNARSAFPPRILCTSASLYPRRNSSSVMRG